jgi:predicted RNA-binding protein YlqC (UPF0109 family)
MSLSNSKPNDPSQSDVAAPSDEVAIAAPKVEPDYIELVKFLVKPFLETADALRVDCEHLAGGKRVMIRLAFDASDRGRVFGRGGRNIQAIRRIVDAAAALAGCQARLDVYGESAHGAEDARRSSGRPSHTPKAKPKPRLKQPEQP